MLRRHIIHHLHLHHPHLHHLILVLHHLMNHLLPHLHHPPPPSPSPPPPQPQCHPYSSVTCKGKVYPTYTCSPPVTSYTQATLTVYDFSRNGDGYGPSKCDGKYHDNSDERVVALSTGWYAANGKSTTAKVVDECDSTRGCDDEHRRPCGYNVVGGSKAVWKALDIDRDEEEVNIVWSVL
ncbi:hypothetical protein ACHQM5_029640 [Ranunculus cassubicifolius]